MDVFISYAREDSRHANQLYDGLLTVEGVTPWLDSKNLLPGVRWKSEVMKAVNACDVFIVLLSASSVSKTGFVQKEIVEALDKLKSMPPDRVFLIPARLDICEPKHPELSDLQWVDLFPDWQAGFDRICRAIRLASRSSLPSPNEDAHAGYGPVGAITSQKQLERQVSVQGDLRSCDAMELRISNVSLAHKDLSGGNFVRCIFDGCDFRSSVLRGANFEGAVFRECRCGGSDLWGVNFWGADIRGLVDFEEARLDLTNFYGTHLTEMQKGLVAENKGAIFLGDYNTFIAYFREQMDDDDAIRRTFGWVSHPYFSEMFRKTADPEHVARLTHLRNQGRGDI